MYNWNDVEVARMIAQERYQRIVEGRRVDRVRQRATAKDPVSPSFDRLLIWLGELLVGWGCALQNRRRSDFQAAVCG